MNREQAIKSWIGEIDIAVQTLQGFKMALEQWKTEDAKDSEFMREYRELDLHGLAQWADGLSDPGVDRLRAIVTGEDVGEIDVLTAVFGDNDD